MSKVKCALIIGMHRSGTSMIGQLLNQTGLYLGVEENRLSADQHNLNGYFEGQLIIQTNDNILLERAVRDFDITSPDKSNFYGMGWIFAPWIGKASVASNDNRIQSALDNYLNGHYSEDIAVIKDPRMVFLLDDWKDYIDIVAVIYIHREPSAVIQSLQQRDKISSTIAGALYAIYNHKCQTILNDYQSISLSYSTMLNDTPHEVARLDRFLIENNLSKKHIDYEQIVSSEYDHSVLEHDFAYSENLHSIYNNISKNQPPEILDVNKFVALKDDMLCETRQMAESVRLQAVVSQFERLNSHLITGSLIRLIRMFKTDKSFGSIPD